MTKQHFSQRWQRTSAAMLAVATLLGTSGMPVAQARPASMQLSQAQQGWDTLMQFARLVNANQELTAFVVQLDVLNKPVTSYANAVYQLFVRKDGRWVQVYTNKGARLITSTAGRIILEPEVIQISDLRKQLGNDVDLSQLEWRSLVEIRYDVRGGQRDQRLQLERAYAYNAIARSTTTQLVSTQVTTTQTTQTSSSVTQVSTSSQTQGSSVYQTTQGNSVYQTTQANSGYQQGSQNVQLVQACRRDGPLKPNQGQFSLVVLQQQETLPFVTSRVSVKSKSANGYLDERFIGDFRYKLKGKDKKKSKKPKFLKGVNAGDIVVVRLFDNRNQFIGYSQFELLSDHSVVHLVLDNQINTTRTVRTVYGLDSNQDGTIDSGTTVFDYFTRLTQTSQNWSDSRVTFLTAAQALNLSGFNLPGLPSIPRTFVYPTALQSGSTSVLNQVIQAFSVNLAPALLSTPGQLVQAVDIETSSASSYEVTQLVSQHQTIGVSRTSTVAMTDACNTATTTTTTVPVQHQGGSSTSSGSNKKPNCNQGIGNGSEGCDPGRSRPHGGSNDEGGRTPGKKK